MKPILVISLGAILLAPGVSLAKTTTTRSQAVLRQDLVQRLGPVACRTSAAERTLAAWKEGVFDAQVEGRLLLRTSGLDADPGVAMRKARSMAKALHYAGYAAGICPDGRAWAAAVPAPQGVRKSDKAFILPIAQLRERCESWRADFAPASGGAPKELTISREGSISLSSLKGDGTLGVACKPKKPRWLGPQQWFLAPVGKGPSETAPAQELLSAAGAPFDRLSAWISAVRRQTGLPPVTRDGELDRQADLLAIDDSLAHDRLLIGRAGSALKAQSIELFGENRVKGRTLSDMAWLLWNSPRHRNLLLEPRAQHLGIGGRAREDGLFAVIVMGARAPMTTARGDARKGVKAN